MIGRPLFGKDVKLWRGWVLHYCVQRRWRFGFQPNNYGLRLGPLHVHLLKRGTV